MVGRDREQARLRELLNGAMAGIGKTTLVDDLIHEAEHHDCLVLTGGCYDLTTTPPYGPWSDAIRGYKPAEDQPAVLSWFGDPEAMGQVGSQAALFEEVRRFLSAVARWSELQGN